jgi:transposase
MPRRPFSRDKRWLFPPSLDELVGQDHPARFVAAFLDTIGQDGWGELGIEIEGAELGAPGYHPEALLGVWVYGFMTGVRSSRRLEAACRDQLAYMWLTGWQHPDHNTLWRFYESNREGMKKLFKRTVRTAVSMGLVDLAVQAVDGTKIGANAAKVRTLDAEALQKLLERADKQIAEVEAQNKAEIEAEVVRLPEQLAKLEELRQEIKVALEKVEAEDGPKKINLTDEDAQLMKSRQGIVVGYNAQAVGSPLVPEKAGGTGMLITAAEVVTEASDHGQTIPMLEAAEQATGRRAEVSLLDGGYHSGKNLAACEEAKRKVLMPESQVWALQKEYHKDHFGHDALKDSYTCPKGQELRFSGIKKRKGKPEMRVYRATAAVCLKCPAFGECTKDKHQGRAIEIGPYEAELRRHRALMAEEGSKKLYRRRQGIIEPVFGIMKELQGARRFLLRGLDNVRAEWSLLVAAFNLKTLYRVWQRQEAGAREGFMLAVA